MTSNDVLADLDHNLNHWRKAARVARFNNDHGAIIEAEAELDRLLEQRHALVAA